MYYAQYTHINKLCIHCWLCKVLKLQISFDGDSDFNDEHDRGDDDDYT